MRLHEHEAKGIFKSYGIDVPDSKLVSDANTALDAASEIGLPVVLKAQVLVGGRGKAGGIKVCNAQEEVIQNASILVGSEINGQRVKEILVEKKVPVEKELYLGLAVDGYEGRPVLILSGRGGVDIEEVSRTHPEEVIKIPLSPYREYFPYMAREGARALGLQGERMLAISKVIYSLVNLFYDLEALIAEINPLGILSDGRPVALDAVLEVDNSALKRIKAKLPDPIARMENPLERKGREIGVTYVDLDGDVGIISSGAGLGMASMDIIGKRLRPANFLETGGGITEELLYKCMELVCMKPNLRAILINVYGGINPIHEGAKGVVRYIQEKGLKIPIVAKALGNRQEETWEILRSGGVHVVTKTETEAAVEALCQILDKGEAK